MTFTVGLIIGFVVGGAISIFVYRNNQAKMSAYADKIDALVDKLEASVKEKV